MKRLVRYTATPSAIVLILQNPDGGRSSETVTSDDFRFESMTNAVRKDDRDAIYEAFLKKPRGGASFKGNAAVIGGVEIHDPLIAGKMREAVAGGRDPKALARFWERLKKNPRAHVRQYLYNHIEHDGITLTPDGCLILYKRVQDDLRSWYDNSFRYRVGENAQVPRERCLNDPHVVCGFGLHGCPWKRLNGWYTSGTILELIVPPEDLTNVNAEFCGKVLFCNAYVQRTMSASDRPMQSVVEKAGDKRAETSKRKEKGKAGGREVGKLNYLTRRVPSEQLQAAGLQTSKKGVVVIVTDPRSRSFYISDSAETLAAENILKRDTPHYVEEAKVCKDTFTVALPLSVFHACQINPSRGNRSYTVTVIRPNVIEVRPA